MENKSYWTDESGNYHCESCGKIVEKENLFFEKYLGYCKECYEEIQEYDTIPLSYYRQIAEKMIS